MKKFLLIALALSFLSSPALAVGEKVSWNASHNRDRLLVSGE
ncbi:MAG TPA: hypothetical protein VM639_00895 [Dongiaceae bacterium]|nr:hypothetical protein [Dongiaceae bacterium]